MTTNYNQSNNEQNLILTNKNDIFFGISTSGIMLGLTGELNTKENQINALKEYRKISDNDKKLKDFIDFQLTLLDQYNDYLIPIPLIEDVEKLFYKLMDNRQFDDGMQTLKSMSYHIAGVSLNENKENTGLETINHFVENLNSTNLETIDNINEIQRIHTIMSYSFITMLKEFKESNVELHDYFDNIIKEQIEQDIRILI